MRLTAAFVAGLGVAAQIVGAQIGFAAEQASRWDGDARSAVRVIAGAPPADATVPVRAGIELRLQAGWHTYWRYPGDAGVPPRFDFSGSDNVASVTVLWPAPKPIPEQGLTAIGYFGDVIWPLAIVPQNPAKPITLRLSLDYAVCERMCVPVQAKLDLPIAAGAVPDNATLTAALARVPRKVALGEGSALAIRAVRRERGPARDRVVVDVAAPSQATVTLFAEGPGPDWALPVPMPVAGAQAGLRRFAFDLDGAPAGASYDGAAVTLTAVAGETAIELVTHLD